MSTVRASTSGGVGFLADWRRVNVAFTRPRSGLIVLGNAETLSRDHETWGRWLEWVSAHGVNIADPVPRGQLDRAALHRACPSAKILPQITATEISDFNGGAAVSARHAAGVRRVGGGFSNGGMQNNGAGAAISAHNKSFGASTTAPAGPAVAAAQYPQQYPQQYQAQALPPYGGPQANGYSNVSAPAPAPAPAQSSTMAALMGGDWGALMSTSTPPPSAPAALPASAQLAAEAAVKAVAAIQQQQQAMAQQQ